MPIIGEAHINIRALDKNFRRDIERAVQGIRDVGIDLKVSTDISDAQNKIDDLRRATRSSPIEINVRADTQKLEESLKKSTAKVRPVKVSVTANQTDFTKSVRELNDKISNLKVKVPVFAEPKYFKRDIDAFVRNMKLNPVKIPVQMDASAAQKALDAIEKQTQSSIPLRLDTTEAVQSANETATTISNMRPQMSVGADADTGQAEAQISLLTRVRKVKVVVEMEKSAMNSFRGLTEALAGVVPVRQVSQAIESVLSNFSALTVQAGVVTAAMGAMGAGAIAATGSILTISSDIGNLVGLLALAPAGFVTMRMATMTLSKAFEGFGAAVSKGAQYISALHPAAREAATAMHQVVKVMNTEIQGNFWEEASNDMIRFANEVMPDFSQAMQGVATDFGNSFGEMLDAVSDFNAGSGGVESALTNIRTGLGYISDAVRPVTEALLTLGSTGSKYMVDLGQAVRTAGEGFNSFIQEAQKAGDIDRWIQQGITSLQNLASVVASTVTIFGNLSEAAQNAGFGGLQALADGLSAVADASGEALAMERLESIFRGAGTGATELARGLKLIGDTIMESADGLSNFLDLAGQIGRITFENLDALLNADGFGEGITRALEGMKNGLDAATPGFEALGRTIGNLGQIAGTLFETMAPGFNNLMITIDKVVASLTDGFIAAMPVVNQFVDMFMQLVRGPLVLAATAVGKLLELFAMLPAPIQNTVIAVVALSSALKTLSIAGGAIGLLGGKLDNLGGRAGASTGLVSRLGAALGVMGGASLLAGRNATQAADGTAKIADNAGRASGRLSGLGSALGGLAGSLVGVGTGGRTAGDGIGQAGDNADRAGGKFGRVGAAIGGVARTFGPLGLAIAATTAAFTVYDETTGSTATKTAALGTALQQYGSSSAEAAAVTQDLVSSHKGFAESVIDLIPGVESLNGGTTNAARGFETLGWSVEDVSSAINSSGGEWTGYRQKIEDLISETGMFETVTREASIAVLGNASAAGMTGEQLRAMRDAYDDANRGVEEHTQAQIKAQEAAQQAANFNRQVADAVSTNKSAAIEAAGAYDVLASSTSSVGDKMSAFQSTISFVNSEFNKSTGGLMADTQAKMANATATANLDSALANVTATYGQMGEQVITAQGAFVETTAVGRDFYASMQDIATQIQEVGIRTYDTALKNGDSITVAADKAVASMKPMTDQVRTMLQGMGVTGEAEINKVLSALGLLPEDVRLALNAEGNAADVARETKLIVEGLISGNYDMAIGAVNEQAMSVIADTVGAGDDFAAGDYEAVFKALAEKVGVDEAVKLLESTAGKDFEAIMKLIAENPALAELKETEGFMDHLNGKTVEAKIGAINDLGPEVERGLNQLAQVDGKDAQAELKAINDIPDEAQKALGEILGVDGMNAQAVLDAIDNLSPEVRKAIGLTEEANGKTATINMDALDDASPKIVGALDQAIDFDGKKVTTTLDALDNLSPKAREALAEVLGIEDTSGTALLEAIDNLSPQAQAALGIVGQVGEVDSTAVLDAIDNASPLAEYAISGIESLEGKTGTARLEALDNASQTAREALAEVLGIDSAEGTALLSAIDKLTPDAQKALFEMMKVDNQEVIADIMANDEASGKVQTAGLNLDAFMNKPSTKDVGATDNASGIIGGAIAKVGEWLGIPADKPVTAQDNASGVVGDIIGKIGEFIGVPGDKPVGATDNASNIISSAIAKVGEFVSAPGDKPVTAQDNASGPIGGAIAKIREFIGVPGDKPVTATDNASGPIGGAIGKIREFIGAPGSKTVTAQDNASGPISGAVSRIREFVAAPAQKIITALNQTGGPVGAAQAAMNGLKDVTRNLLAKSNVAGAVGAAQGAMNGLKDVTRTLLAKSNVAGAVGAAQGAMNGLKDVTRNLNAKNMTAAAKAAAQSTLDSLRDVSRNLNAKNMTAAAKAAAQSTLDSLRDVSRDLNAKNLTAGPKAAAQGIINSLAGKSVDLNARNLVGGAVSAAKAAISTVVGKTVDIVSRFIKIGSPNADGNIYAPNGASMYANGGIAQAEAFANGGIKMPNVKSFASGSENHVAQIARGAWPVRIWAEPETGGEAYIPLGVNKRPRSLDILKKVAEMFGFSLVKKFADGGILKGLPTSKTGHFADGGFNGAPKNISGFVTGRSERVETTQASAGNVIYSPTMHVYPSSQLNEEQVAEHVSRDLFWKIINH